MTIYDGRFSAQCARDCQAGECHAPRTTVLEQESKPSAEGAGIPVVRYTQESEVGE